MKQTLKLMIALLAVAAMVLSLAACGAKDGGKQEASSAPDSSAVPASSGASASLMEDIFYKLTVNDSYLDWKAALSATKFEEKIDGNTITITAEGEEGVNGEYAYTLDGDYIVNTSEPEDYSGYAIMMFLKDAVADHYGMSTMLMSGYVAGLEFFGKENTFLTSEEADGKAVNKLYAASAWDMQGLDEMYINDAALEYTDALTENTVNTVINAGKISAVSYGSKDELILVVGEYGENTDLTLQSIQNMIAKLQPTGYEAFAEGFTALQETSGNGYTVSFGVPQDIADAHDVPQYDGYSYVTVVIPADAAESVTE